MRTTLESDSRPVDPPELDQDQHFVLWSDWNFYERLLKAHGADNIRLRLTYNRGKLELTNISSKHDKLKYLVGRVIDTISAGLDVPLIGMGQTTVRRKDLDCGFEPDAWYYIQNATRMLGLDRELNFEVDSPPDLAVEIDIVRGWIDRIGLYSSLAVKEIWRCADAAIRILVLQPDGKYADSANSLAFPKLTTEDLNRIVNEAKLQNSTSYFRALRNWVHEEIIVPTFTTPLA